jgi:hypothetical protein
MPSSLVDRYQCEGGYLALSVPTTKLHGFMRVPRPLQWSNSKKTTDSLKMKTTRSFETSETTRPKRRRDVPEDRNPTRPATRSSIPNSQWIYQ